MDRSYDSDDMRAERHQDRIDQAYESSAIVEWQASIAYDPDEAEWGVPEQEFEAAMEKSGILLSGMDGGTDLTTGTRDFTWYFNATHDEAREVGRQFGDWTIEPV